ncbi:hypothetical protein I79_026166 [Cricetulus griseus]|uniref:Uncharacterized protein n=1 Tax=Cricetulus griseus TaxID=10029 RepID=G3IQ70_CRIGR|nr:hypothetical protein I79_026166 [Cricetulus griseus]
MKTLVPLWSCSHVKAGADALSPAKARGLRQLSRIQLCFSVIIFCAGDIAPGKICQCLWRVWGWVLQKSYNAQDILPPLPNLTSMSLLRNDAWPGKVAHTCNLENSEFESSLDT